jgi:transposase, IS5 family
MNFLFSPTLHKKMTLENIAMRGQSSQQLSFGEGFIDPRLFELDDELKHVDELLYEGEFLKPFEAVFDPSMGRPGTAVDVYLRMMYLKFRWGLSYEEVEAEVRERLPWRRFCHLSLMDTVPDATTLIKLNQRFGDERIALLNKKLVKHLVKAKAIKPRRIRIDSTTLEAHITYPTDIGLIHQVVKTLTRTAGKLGTKITSHVRATKKAVAHLGASLKSSKKERKARAIKALRSIMVLAKDTVQQSQKAMNRISHRTCGAHPKLQKTFAEQIALAKKILQQSEQKLAGVKAIEERIVSFSDPEARVIRKGKLNKPNEFGRTMQLVQDSSGIMLDYQIYEGNPSDKTELLPTLKRFTRQYRYAPTAVAADKGYYTPQNITDLRALGVRRIGIPKIGRLSQDEKKRQRKSWFKLLYRFRCGIEAGISMLKRQFSLGRVRGRGSTGTRIWTAFAIFSYNLWQRA